MSCNSFFTISPLFIPILVLMTICLLSAFIYHQTQNTSHRFSDTAFFLIPVQRPNYEYYFFFSSPLHLRPPKLLSRLCFVAFFFFLKPETKNKCRAACCCCGKALKGISEACFSFKTIRLLFTPSNRCIHCNHKLIGTSFKTIGRKPV